MSVSRFWRAPLEREAYGQIIRPQRFQAHERNVLTYSERIVRTTKRELERFYDWRLDRLDFFFLDDRQPNAVTLDHRNRHGIGMCVGLPFTILGNLEAALANTEFLAKYMTAEERPEWAWRYLGMIVEHAYLHEVAHAVRGHLPYRRRTSERPVIDERMAKPNLYLELDADLQALDMWLSIAEKADDFPKQEHLLLDLHFQKLLTTLFLFQAFDTDNLTIQRQRGQSHPPPVHRAMLLDAALRDTFPGRYGLPKREVEKVHAEAWGEAAIAARAAKLTPNRWWGSSRRAMGRRTYSRMVRQYLDRVEPRLNRFVETLPDDLV